VLGYEEILMTQDLDVPVEVFRSLEAAEAQLTDRRPGQPEST
jgi:hypothetical protein